MKKVNVVFDDEFDQVDIILVPDDVANNIERVVWDFNEWLSLPENKSRFLVEDHRYKEKVLCIGTEEFLWWLNNVRIHTKQTATILAKNSKLILDYPRAEF